MTTTFDVRAHGAVGDGVTKDTAAIQAAIDACGAAGGGRVLLPAGHRFLSGSLRLRSFVDLHVERGARLLCSGDLEDLTEHVDITAVNNGAMTPWNAFLVARDETDVAITGGGTIDGVCANWIDEDRGAIYWMKTGRPFLVYFIACTRVQVSDVHLHDAALWALRVSGCDDVLFHGLSITCDMKVPNADGIDIDHSRSVRVSDCNVQVPDDAISIKACEESSALSGGVAQDIVVTNCVLESRSSALVVGVDAGPGDVIRNVVFNNCVIRNSHRGLSVNCGSGALYENILFANIVIETRIFDDRWWGRGEPIYVSSYPWHDAKGRIRNVRFSNILARSESGVVVSAQEPGDIEGLVFDNVAIRLGKWSEYEGGQIDHRPFNDENPIISAETAGFHLHNATNVRLTDCSVDWEDGLPDYYGPALRAQSVEGLVVRDFVGHDRPGWMSPILAAPPSPTDN